MWGWAEICDDTRNCTKRGKEIGKLNIYTENGIFSWFLGVGSVPGNSDPGLGFFISVTVWFFLSLFFCFALRARNREKNFTEYVSLHVALLFVHSSASQPKQTQCHTSAVLWGLKAGEKLHQPGSNLFSSSSPWRNVFCKSCLGQLVAVKVMGWATFKEHLNSHF